MRHIGPARRSFVLQPLAAALATAALLGAALPARAQTQYYDYSGSVLTDPFNFFPFDRFTRVHDFSGNRLLVGMSTPGSFSALAGASLKVDGIDLGGGGTGSGTALVNGASTKVELVGSGSRLQIGNWGTGSLTVSGGALLDATVNAASCGSDCWNVVGNAAGSTGTLNIDGSGSEVRTLRYFALGTAWVSDGFGTPGGTTHAFLNITNGGTLRTEATLLANGPAGPNALGTERTFAEAVVDGANSRWYVTRNSIDGGGLQFSAGNDANSKATVTVRNGAQLILDASDTPDLYSNLTLGRNGGRGDLVVSSGGKVLFKGAAESGGNTVFSVGGYGTGSQGSATVTGAGSEIVITGAHASLNVGEMGATGQLDVLNLGRVASGNLYIGNLSGTGTVSVTGGKIDLDGTDGRMIVGNGGVGSLVVSAGGVVDATLAPEVCAGYWCGNVVAHGAGSTGTLTITGAGSKVLTLRSFNAADGWVDDYTGTPGGTSRATISILDGGKLQTGAAYLATAPGGPNALGTERAFANVTIDGPGSQWVVTRNSIDNAIAFFGAATHANAAATIAITNGGRLLVDGTGSVGPFDGIGLGYNGGHASLTVSGAGSSVEVSAANPFMNLGRGGGTASFGILDGAAASLRYLSVGRDSASTGIFLVDGAGSTLTLSGTGTPGVAGAAGAYIGRDGGQGSATVSRGGRLLVTDGGADTRNGGYGPEVILGLGANSSGTLVIDGSGSKVEIVSSSLGLGSGVPDNYNAYMSVGSDAGSTGQLTVSNGGKLLLTGNAVSTIADSRGTTLNIGGHSNSVAGGNGSALVSGPGSEIRVSGSDAFIGIGRAGSVGSLTVSNQGLVATTNMNVGRAGNGSLTLDNATIDLSGQQTGSNVPSGAGLSIGNRGGTGYATIDHGSRVTITNLGSLGASLNLGGTGPNPLGNGTLALLGGSQIKITAASGQAALTVGRDGTGLLVTDGASSIDVGDGKVYIGRFAGSTGTLLLGGASTLNAGYVGVGSNLGVDGGSGTLIISGSTVNAPIVEIGTNGYLGGRNGVINGDVYNGGEVGPGESRGRIIINGAFYGSTRSPFSMLSKPAPMAAGAPGRLILEVESDGHGGFLTDELVLTKGSDYDFAGMRIVFSFLGAADPNQFDKAHGFEMDTFLRSLDGAHESGLSGDFAPGTDWGDVLAQSQFRARAQQFTDVELHYNPVDGSFQATAIPGVPEPATWALMMAGVALVVVGVHSRANTHGRSLAA